MGRKDMSWEGDASREILLSMSMETENPALLLELHYWSLEPDALQSLRFFLGMSAEARQTLGAFQALAADPQSVQAQMHETGAVTLVCTEPRRIVGASEQRREVGERVI